MNIYSPNTVIKSSEHNADHAELQGMAGEIRMYGGDNAPTGWLLCQGQAISRVVYSTLYNIIGTKFGVGDNSTTFNLPDMQDRFPIGKSGTKALGSTGGAATVNLQHSHTVNSHTHTVSHTHTYSGTTGIGSDQRGAADGSNGLATNLHTHDYSGTTSDVSNGNTGGATPGTNNQLSSAQSILPSYTTVNFIIKT